MILPHPILHVYSVVSSQCKPSCTPAHSQWQMHHAIQAEASYTTPSNRKGVAITKINKAAGRDDVLVDQLKFLGPKAHGWLLTMLNKCFMENKIPTLWRQSKIIAILKLGKHSAIQKNYRPISLWCHPYILDERMILNTIAPTIEQHLIKEHAGFILVSHVQANS